MALRILCIGDIVGRPARRFLRDRLAGFVEANDVGFTVVNGENAAAGSGLTPKVLQELLDAGADVVTSGDHVYKNREIFQCIDHESLLRPMNYVPDAAGHGFGRFAARDGTPVAVLNLQGRVFMDPAECPFRAADEWLASLGSDATVRLVDMHAEATSEKVAMGWHLDGRVAAVFGTHTHVQTADEQILPQGTAYMSDLGMTGAHKGIIGRDVSNVLHRFTTGMPARFEVATEDVRMKGLMVDVDADAGTAIRVERVSLGEEAAV
jgi:hypothetical protein